MAMIGVQVVVLECEGFSVIKLVMRNDRGEEEYSFTADPEDATILAANIIRAAEYVTGSHSIDPAVAN